MRKPINVIAFMMAILGAGFWTEAQTRTDRGLLSRPLNPGGMTTMKRLKIVATFYSIFLAVFGLAAAAPAQSTNESSPTALTTTEYTGKPPTKETTYYFNFSGGPGEVSVRLEIKAKQYSTFARLEILDAELNTLATHNMNASTASGTGQVLKKLELNEKQTLLIKITFDGNLASYKIVLGGAVDAGAPSSSQTGTSETGGAQDAGASPQTAASSEAGSSSTPTESTSGSAPTETPTPSSGGNKFFNVDLGKFKLGQLINMPKSGTLIIQMKDGTTHEIDLMSVKNLTIKKN